MLLLLIFWLRFTNCHELFTMWCNRLQSHHLSCLFDHKTEDHVLTNRRAAYRICFTILTMIPGGNYIITGWLFQVLRLAEPHILFCCVSKTKFIFICPSLSIFCSVFSFECFRNYTKLAILASLASKTFLSEIKKNTISKKVGFNQGTSFVWYHHSTYWVLTNLYVWDL